MAIAGLISSLAGIHGKAEQSSIARNEGTGSYDPFTGKFYDPQKTRFQSGLRSTFNPAGAIRDPYLKPWEKVLSAGGFGALFSGKRTGRIEAENKAFAKKYEAIQEKVSDLPGYEVPAEAQEKLAVMEEASAGISEAGQEITDIANKRAGRTEMREAQMVREDIKQNSAARLQSIQESGSGETLSAIAKAGGMEQAELRNLNKKQTAYRFQAESDLMNAKINQASMEAAGAQLEGAGLTGIIQEKGKVYQSELDKQLTGINLDIARYSGGQMGQIQAQQNAATNNAAFASGVANTALSYINNRSMMKNSGQGQ